MKYKIIERIVCTLSKQAEYEKYWKYNELNVYCHNLDIAPALRRKISLQT